MEKGALLLASYGTTHDDARSRGLDVLERELTAAFPLRELVTAFTSAKVLRAVEARGDRVASVGEACAALADRGFDDIVVLPALVTFGGSHDAIVRACAPFPQARIASPLLADARDARVLAEILSGRHPRIGGEVLVLVGHGSGEQAEAAFALLQEAFRALGRDDALVSTLHVEGGAEGLAGMLPAGTLRVRLVPLLLTAGSHVRMDLHGDGASSWTSRFRAAGFAVDCIEEGHSEIGAVRQIFMTHARESC